MRKLQTFPPLGKLRTSGSRPRLPIKMTLFTEPAIAYLLSNPLVSVYLV